MLKEELSGPSGAGKGKSVLADHYIFTLQTAAFESLISGREIRAVLVCTERVLLKYPEYQEV